MTRVSLVTVTYNSARTIRETVESVLRQQSAVYSYTVVDGKSQDDTNVIVGGLCQNVSFVNHISEPDRGIYDAMNKGVARSSGDFIGFLNSDDFFADEFVLRDITKMVDQTGADIVYGDIEIFEDDSDRRTIRSWKSGKYCKNILKFGWHPPHPAFYMKRSLFESLGGFDLSIGLAADYDLMIRALMSPGCKVAYLNRVIVKMRHGGASTSGLKPIVQGWVSCQKPWQKLGRPYLGALAATLKPLRKILQVRL